MSLVRGTVASVSCNDVYSFTKPARDEIVLVAGIGVEGDVHAGVNVRHRSRVKADPTQPNLRQVHLIHEELFDEVGEKGYSVEPGNLGENVTTSGIDLLGLPLGTILRFGPPASAGAAGGGEGPSDGGEGAAGGGDGVAGGGEGAAGGGDGVAGGGDGVAGGGEGVAGGGDGAAGAGVSGEGAVDSGSAVLAPVLGAAAAAVLDEATAAAAEAVAAAAARSDAAAVVGGEDRRAAVIVAGLRNPCAQINRFQQGLLKEVIGQDADGNVVRKGGVMGVVLRGGPIRAGDEISVELPPVPFVPLEKI
ncbi:MOSC domain-containing protein [Actinoplanes sp. CA-131856]